MFSISSKSLPKSKHKPKAKSKAKTKAKAAPKPKAEAKDSQAEPEVVRVTRAVTDRKSTRPNTGVGFVIAPSFRKYFPALFRI